MANQDKSNIFAKGRAGFSGQEGIRANVNPAATGGLDNNFIQRAKNAAGTDYIDLLGTDAMNNLLLGGAVRRPLATPIRCQISAAAKIGQTTPFFVNCNDVTPLEIVRIDCTYGTADGAANTGYVSKEIQGQAAPGTSCMTGTFDLNTTTNTPQNATLAGVRGTKVLMLGPGEQLTFNIASALTSLASLYVTVWVRPHTGMRFAQYVRPANGDIATGTMDLNIVPGTIIRAVAMRWGTAASNAGTVTADVTKDTSTNAPGAGTSILAAAQSVKGAANTTVFPSLSATASVLSMAHGDRLAVKMTGTLTALAGLVVTVFYSAGPDEHIVIPVSFWDAVATNRTLFLGNAGYWVVADFWATWSVAATTKTLGLTKDSGATAPGGGTELLTDNTNTGIDLSATANTPVEGTLTTVKPNLWLGPNDRLGAIFAGATTGSLAGDFATILLRRP